MTDEQHAKIIDIARLGRNAAHDMVTNLVKAGATAEQIEHAITEMNEWATNRAKILLSERDAEKIIRKGSS